MLDVRDFFIAVIAIKILPEDVIVPGKILDQNLLNSNFYKMASTPDLNIRVEKLVMFQTYYAIRHN